jgi:hypothetical protein
MDPVRRILEGALSWLDGNRSFFMPLSADQLIGPSVIPLSELAILTLSLLRTEAKSVECSLIDRFLDVLEQAYEESVFRERSFRDPESLVSYLMVKVALERGGRVSPNSQRAELARLVRFSNLAAPALPPHRTMELRHALDLAAVSHEMPSYRDLYLRTMVAREINPIFLSRPEAYVLTHVVFYIADLGYCLPRGITTSDRWRLSTLINQMLGMSLVSRNWDLTAEFILSALCLDTPGEFIDIGWNYLSEAQRSDGSVPGWRSQSMDEDDSCLESPLGVTAPTDYVSACYHTTLVAALASLTQIHKRSEAP